MNKHVRLVGHTVSDANERALRMLIDAGEIPEEFHDKLAGWWMEVRRLWPKRKKLERDLKTMRERGQEFRKIATSIENIIATIQSDGYKTEIWGAVFPRSEPDRTHWNSIEDYINDLHKSCDDRLFSMLKELEFASIVFDAAAYKCDERREGLENKFKGCLPKRELSRW